MAMRKFRGKRKAPGKRRGLRRLGGRRRHVRVGSQNTCKVVETLTTINLQENAGYLVQKAGITGPRASAIAPNFGLYRIAKITYTIKPFYDTYAPGAAPGGSNPLALPSLYWKMNRYGDAPAAFNADYLRTQGAKPRRLDDKNLVISYKPNILLQQSAAGSPGSEIRMTPWLSTDQRPNDNVFSLSTTQHQGHIMYIEGGATGSGTGVVANMDITVVYEFKNPRAPDSVAQVSSTPLVVTNL